MSPVPAMSPEPLGDVKIRLPASVRIRLHQLKILHGTSISAFVCEAVVRHLAAADAAEADGGRD